MSTLSKIAAQNQNYERACCDFFLISEVNILRLMQFSPAFWTLVLIKVKNHHDRTYALP